MKRFLCIFLLSCTEVFCSEIRFSHKTDCFATHQPVLYEIAKNTTGPIIEFGCGNGSTDLLHAICEEEQRILISVDDDLDWLTRFADKYKDDEWHHFYYVPKNEGQDSQSPEHWVKFLDEFHLLKTTNFDLCFIDQSPWLARYETLKRLKGQSRYVIVHDCDYFPIKGVFGSIIEPIRSTRNLPGKFDFSDVFRTFKVYFPLAPWPSPSGPPTLLGSDFESELPEIDYSRY